MRRRLEFASASPLALAGLAAYAAAVIGGIYALATLTESGARQALEVASQMAPVIVQASAASEIPRVARIEAVEQALPPVELDADAFEHARTAPMFVERNSTDQIEVMKQSVSERIVSDDPAPWFNSASQTFKTMCVRLCDGAYFPISYSTTRQHFARDEAVCASRCAAPARLFVFPNPGGNPEKMRDRSGHSYVALPTAFQFRRGGVSGCSCKAEPWEQASKQRHRLYALEQTLASGGHVDMAELTGLRARFKTVKVAVRTPRKPTAAIVTAALPEVPSGNPDALGASALPPAAPQVALNAVELNTLAALPPGVVTDRVSEPFRPVSMVTPRTEIAAHSAGSQDASIAPPLPEPAPAPLAHASIDQIEPLTARTSGPARSTNRQQSRRRGPRKPKVVASNDDYDPAVAPVALKPLAKAGRPRIWGVGPNAYNSPRGSSAYETFARNFY